MKSHAIMTEGDPGTFDITDKDNPLYYIARYCHEMSDNLYHLSDEGFMWEQNLASEINAHEVSWNTYIGTVYTWMATAIAASEAGTTIPTAPTPPAIISIAGSGGYLFIVFKAMVRLATYWLQRKLDSDTDATEIAQVLKRAFLKEDGEGDEFAIMEQLSNTPLEIVVSAEQGFEDVVYSDRPET